MTEGLVAALAKVQANLPKIGKTKTANTGTYSYKYADLADISEKLYPLLSAEGLAFIALPKFRGGHYLLMGALKHISGEAAVGWFPLPNGSPQQIGSAISYGRRYLLCCLTGVVADEDDDGQAAEKAATKAVPVKKKPAPRILPDIREPLWADIKAAREAKGWTAAEVQSDFAFWTGDDNKKLMDATADELQGYLAMLNGTATPK